MIKTEKAERIPFEVEYVRVTEENMVEAAEWCNGEVMASSTDQKDSFIKVRVHRPVTKKQTEAHVGDYILYAGTGYKVYTQKAFEKSFRKTTSQLAYDLKVEMGEKSPEEIAGEVLEAMTGLREEAVAEGDNVSVLDELVMPDGSVKKLDYTNDTHVSTHHVEAVAHNHSGPVCSSRCPANRKYPGDSIVQGQKLPIENLQFSD